MQIVIKKKIILLKIQEIQESIYINFIFYLLSNIVCTLAFPSYFLKESF